MTHAILPSHEEDSLLMLRYNRDGIRYGRMGDFEASIKSFEQVILLQKKMYGETTTKMVTPLNNIGIQYKNLGEYEKAIENYLRAEKLYITEYGENYPRLGYLYNNIGTIYKLKGDFVKNNEYQKNAFRIFVNEKDLHNTAFQTTLFNMAESFFLLKKYNEAIKACQENIRQVDDNIKSYYTSLLARIYAEKGEAALADKYYRETFRILTKLSGADSYDLGLEYANYVSFLLSVNQFDQVTTYNELSEKIVEKFFTRKSIQYSQVMLNYADYYFSRTSEASLIADFKQKKRDDLLKALDYYQRAIVAATESFSNPDPASNPEIEQAVSEIQLLEILKKKSVCYNVLGDLNLTASQKQESVNNYLAAFEAISISTELLHQIRTGYVSEESRLFLSENQESTFIEAVNICYKLYSQTNDLAFALKGFEFMEKSKSASFLAAVKDSRAKQFGGIPDSLLNREDILKLNISNYKQMLFEENQLPKPDSAKVALFNSKIFQYSEQYDQLVQLFEESFPNYYSFKYKNDVVDFYSIRKRLKNNDAIVEYLIEQPNGRPNSGRLFRFVITNDRMSFTKTVIDSVFVNDIEKVYQFLTSPTYLYTGLDDYKSYTLSAYNLYQQLLAGVKDDLKGKHLIVIPDDKLAYIPFDALLTSFPDTTVMNFRTLPYLVRDYSVSYTYSTTLLYNYFENHKKAKKGLLAFAPSYENDERDYNDLSVFRSGLLPLPAVEKEVSYINNYVSGDIFRDLYAQEKTFKKMAADYDILHLAMHTILNDTLPMFSRLAFAKPNRLDDEDDGWLNTNEIYMMKLNARMAVLSACNTGSGKLQKGEGVMSLARGFLYAGCPSIVMTLWEVEDESGALIMKDFYRMLSKGKKKNDALRLAKLAHIENADPLKAHPHYWLGYVAVGNTAPLFVSKDFYFIAIIFGILLLIFIDQVIRRRKSKRIK
ncbi:CHAT domain-containing protein [Gaoshiqia sp. Z1-71]|uniref:CHAT domain-containing protein n=1 Tax=Gaoshiqia hydrogeniformans TaxID=3290090 RepID=UPI003BF822D7